MSGSRTVLALAGTTALLMAACTGDLPVEPAATDGDPEALLAATEAAPAQNGIPEHGHALLLHADWRWLEENEDEAHEGLPYKISGFQRCVELAGGQALHLGAHHDRVHFGTAGERLSGTADHLVVPLEPFGPWAGCDEIEADILQS